MIHLIIVRPGSTDLDEQGRIKGTIDIPLSAQGCQDARRTADELHEQPIEFVYSAPCQSAQQTARHIARDHGARLKIVDLLKNLDLGLWNGKRIDELKRTQPRLYRQWQEHPETVSPPGGETLEQANRRIHKVLHKLFRKTRSGTIALVVPEPLATIVAACLRDARPCNLWKVESVCGNWESIDIDAGVAAAF